MLTAPRRHPPQTAGDLVGLSIAYTVKLPGAHASYVEAEAEADGGVVLVSANGTRTRVPASQRVDFALVRR